MSGPPLPPGPPVPPPFAPGVPSAPPGFPESPGSSALGRARSPAAGPTTLASAESDAPPNSGACSARTSEGTRDWYSGSRAVSTGLRDSLATVPSGSSAGMSIALCRA